MLASNVYSDGNKLPGLTRASRLVIFLFIKIDVSLSEISLFKTVFFILHRTDSK